MSGRRYTDEFKIEAVRQVTEHGRSVVESVQRLGITSHSLYACKKAFAKPDVVRQGEQDQSAEMRHLKVELKRVTEERDIFKKAAAYFAKGKGRVRVHPRPHQRVPFGRHVPGAWGPSKRLLRMKSYTAEPASA